ncbi:MAG TPA: hypothetical protein VJQ56_10775, partial [Blastocatellia bacterium]|nr:hypothetical protein [Blastocatellia bacterium]
TARVQVAPGQGTRYQPEPAPDLSNFEQSTFSEVFTGIVPASDTGLQIASGVTFVDVPFTSKTGAVAVIGRLTSALTGVDMDLELRDAAGRVIASSGTAESNETVSAAIQPNSNYTYRIIGWAGVAQDYSLESVQTLLVPRAGATGGAGSGLTTPGLGTVSNLFRFTVNPLTRTVTVQLLRR